MTDPPVSVLVPYRGDDGGPRDAAWAYVQEWWGQTHPGWQLVQGVTDGAGPWVKAHAVAAALEHATGDVLVVADADVFCDGVAGAVEAVQAREPWAVPHERVNRLTQHATAGVLAGGPLPPEPDTPTRRRTAPTQRPAVRLGVQRSYVGVEGGGLVVLPRVLYDVVPLDPRFRGWGQEDQSWAHALTVVGGPRWRGAASLWHLWHPPQARINKRDGNLDGLALRRRYRAATTVEGILAILAEADPDPC